MKKNVNKIQNRIAFSDVQSSDRLLFLSDILIRTFGLSLGDRVSVESVPSKTLLQQQSRGKLTIFGDEISKVNIIKPSISFRQICTICS